MRALVVGGASWNTILHLDALPEARPHTVIARDSYDVLGGTGAGKALGLARLGHEVHLHALLGDDEPGERVVAALVAAGVHLHVDRSVTGTEQHVNLMDPAGARLSLFRSVCAPADDLDLGPVLDLALAADVVVLNIVDYVRRVVPGLRERQVPFWTDLHDWDGTAAHQRDFAEAAASVVLSDDGAADPESLARSLAERAELVVLTRGSRGATAYAAGRVQEVPAVPVPSVRDTNGAGDAFTAGLIHGLGAGWPLEAALTAGAHAAALSVRVRDLVAPDLTADLLAGLTGMGGVVGADSPPRPPVP